MCFLLLVHISFLMISMFMLILRLKLFLLL